MHPRLNGCRSGESAPHHDTQSRSGEAWHSGQVGTGRALRVRYLGDTPRKVKPLLAYS